jgi:hypothetical protein
MDSYYRSIPGRLLAFALALPLVAGATIRWDAAGVGYYTLPVIIGISLAFIAVGLGAEDYPGESVAGVLALPVALFLYVLLVGIVVPQVHAVVYVMAAAACALLVIAAKPGLVARAGKPSLPTATHTHSRA